MIVNRSAADQGGVFAFVEGCVGDPLEEFGVMRQGADVAPVNIIQGIAEVLGGQARQPGQHGVNLGLAYDEGVESGCARLGHGHLPGCLPMKA